jgi:hypothetical protein
MPKADERDITDEDEAVMIADNEATDPLGDLDADKVKHYRALGLGDSDIRVILEGQS